MGWMTQVSSMNLNQNLGDRGRPEGFPLKMFHVQIGNYGAYWWAYSHSLNLLIEFLLKWEVCIMQTEPQKIYDVL